MRWAAVLLLGCSHPASPPATTDAATAPDATSPDAAVTACAYEGAPGTCIATTDCAAVANHSSFAGLCPGPAAIQCCVETPSVANNPPTPVGYKLMLQADVTPAMTTWAVMILDAPMSYPMFSTTTMVFGTLTVLARVEWHPPDFQNNAIHRGVTLYEPI
ncbi:MAG TPA: hypothetical protein VIV58_24125 [Kofleriaceae bacterium]